MGNRSTAIGMDRRGFLRSTALVSSGLVLSATAGEQPDVAGSEDLNIALLGAGDQGQVLLAALLRMKGVRVSALCDIWTDYNLKEISRTLSQFGHKHHDYTDYREMLEKEKSLDAVLIATPDFRHAEHTVACLEAGVNVYCESPMSNTLEGAQQTVKAARESGKLLQIGHQRRSNPRYLHCGYNLLGEVKLLGRLTTAYAQCNRPVQPDRGWPRRAPVDEATLKKHGFQSMHQFRNWRWYRTLGGGPLAAFGSHQIDVLNWFLGAPPQSVIASAGTDYYDDKTHEWPDTVMAVFEYSLPKGTARAFLQIINTNGNLGHYEKLMGDHGAMIISEESGFVALYPEDTARDWDRWVALEYLSRPPGQERKAEDGSVTSVTETVGPTHYTIPMKFEDPKHKPHLENFFEAVRGKAQLTCPAEVAYQTAVTVTKVREAAEAGRKLEIKPEELSV